MNWRKKNMRQFFAWVHFTMVLTLLFTCNTNLSNLAYLRYVLFHFFWDPNPEPSFFLIDPNPNVFSIFLRTKFVYFWWWKLCKSGKSCCWRRHQFTHTAYVAPYVLSLKYDRMMQDSRLINSNINKFCSKVQTYIFFFKH